MCLNRLSSYVLQFCQWVLQLCNLGWIFTTTRKLLLDHSRRKMIFSLIMNWMFIWNPKITRKIDYHINMMWQTSCINFQPFPPLPWREITSTFGVGMNVGHFALIIVVSSYVNPRQVQETKAMRQMLLLHFGGGSLLCGYMRQKIIFKEQARGGGGV